MKHKKIFSFILIFIIIFNSFQFDVLASESNEKWETVPDYSENDIETIIKNIPSYMSFILTEGAGVVTGRDITEIWDDSRAWFDEHKSNMIVVRNTSTGDLGIKVNKIVTDNMLSKLKEMTTESDNGGYELMKTVPFSKISSLYFANGGVAINSLLNLLKDNNGIVGLYSYSNLPYFYQIPDNVYYVKQPWVYKGALTDYKEREFNGVKIYKNMSDGNIRIPPKQLFNSDVVAKNWEDNLTGGSTYCYASLFPLYDSFSWFTEQKQGYNPLAIDGAYYLVTTSGASIPVFNTIDDAVAYTVSNNLYYTSSEYTGEGKEIIITFEEIEKINNGYYDGMYDLLQQLIEQKGSGLTPEQLQELTDEVRASFGMIKDEINKGFEQQDILIQKNSSILQNIADALNTFFSQTKDFRNVIYDTLKNIKIETPSTDNSVVLQILDAINKGFGDIGTRLDNLKIDIPPDTDSGGMTEKILAAIKDGFNDTIKQLKKIRRWTALDTVFDGLDAIADGLGVTTDIFRLLKDLFEGGTDAVDKVADFVSTGADALSGVKELVEGKFPFCIPSDVLKLMQVLACAPEPPKFEIPIVLERYGIDEKLVIDFTDFEYVSTVCRTFLSIAWCFALMNMTTKITDMKSI